MTFHRLTKANDGAGIVPTVFAIDKHGKHDRKRYSVSASQVPAQAKPIRLQQSALQQGPLRHPDFVEWSGDGSPFGFFFVVSPRVHALLGLAELPAHEVFDALVQFPKNAHRTHGRGESPYFVYTFDQVQTLDALDLSATSLTATVRRLSERMNTQTELPAGSVATGAEAWKRAQEICPKGQRPSVVPTALMAPMNSAFEPEIDFSSPHFPIATRDVDLLWFDHSFDPWIGEELWAALVAMQVTGVDSAEFWDATRLRSPATDDRAQRAATMLAHAEAKAGPPPTNPLFERHQQRRTEVLARRDRLREMRGKNGEHAIDQLEERLDVEFPTEYRTALFEGTLPTRGRFAFLAMSDLKTLDDIDPEWTARSAPHAVRALIVAVDDSGDYLGYILREDSMTALDGALMHFHHETEAVTPSRFRFEQKVSARKGPDD